MMKKHIILIPWALLMPFLLSATDRRHPEASVHGHVIDRKTGEHVPFLVVSLRGTTVATSTGDSGHYFLEHLPEGTFILQVSGLGYKTVSEEVVLKDGVALEVNFYVEEDNVLLDGVVVSANRSETARMMAPTLVNVVNINMDTYDMAGKSFA